MPEKAKILETYTVLCTVPHLYFLPEGVPGSTTVHSSTGEVVPGFDGNAVEGVLQHVGSGKPNLIFLAVASHGDI